MPDLIRLYITNVIIGFVISAVVVAGLLWFNVANLGHLVATSDIGLMAVLLLWLFNGIVFAGVQFAIAIMSMSDDDDDDDDGGHPAWDPILIPIRTSDRR
jgi:hypothetical protein